ncbi:transposable element Tcb2 transposase [Trichonephila clavipes]|nr:transposable element Tcb2 transposase [Trichonephila clavipes]
MGRRCETCLAVSGEIISPTKDRMFLAGHPSQGCFGLQSHCAPCYFFNQASFYPSDFSFSIETKQKTITKLPVEKMKNYIYSTLIVTEKCNVDVSCSSSSEKSNGTEGLQNGLCNVEDLWRLRQLMVSGLRSMLWSLANMEDN